MRSLWPIAAGSCQLEFAIIYIYILKHAHPKKRRLYICFSSCSAWMLQDVNGQGEAPSKQEMGPGCAIHVWVQIFYIHEREREVSVYIYIHSICGCICFRVFDGQQLEDLHFGMLTLCV